MGQAIPTQHPAVVLRSRFNQLRALLAVAMIAVIGLSIAVVIVANDEAQVRSTSAARPAESIRYGGLNPSTHQPRAAPAARASDAEQAREHALRRRQREGQQQERGDRRQHG
jgi:hypothetical protein